MLENKQEILDDLLIVLNKTRAGIDIVNLEYNAPNETVTIEYAYDCRKIVNVACDSGITMIIDVLEKMLWGEGEQKSV